MVRAKFRCTNVIHTASNFGTNGGERTDDRVILEPVCDDANKTWSKWTPCGKLEMSINNPAALGQFKPGECYFVDFTPAAQREQDEAK